MILMGSLYSLSLYLNLFAYLLNSSSYLSICSVFICDKPETSDTVIVCFEEDCFWARLSCDYSTYESVFTALSNRWLLSTYTFVFEGWLAISIELLTIEGYGTFMGDVSSISDRSIFSFDSWSIFLILVYSDASAI